MKIAVISDIHGNAVALNYAIKDLKNLGISKIIILGDVVMKGPMPSQVLEALIDKDFEILAWIKGNTDLWLEEISDAWAVGSAKEKELYSYYKYTKDSLTEAQIQFLKELPLEGSIAIGETKILCVHGTPKSIVEAIDDSVPKEDIRNAIAGVKEETILSGHSHTSYIGEIDGKKIFNVGSVGNSLDGDNSISYGILDFSERELTLINRRISYPVNEIIDIAAKNNFPMLDEYKKIIATASMG